MVGSGALLGSTGTCATYWHVERVIYLLIATFLGSLHALFVAFSFRSWSTLAWLEAIIDNESRLVHI